MADFQTFQDKLGHQFRDAALLRLALTHPSVAHEQGAAMQTNQRLEFLGDAVLQLILSMALYERYPAVGEGPLTKARAKLVNRRTLAQHAKALSLGDYLILSHGEEIHGGRQRESALADAFEAVLGAIYLDAGLSAAQAFVLRNFEHSLSDVSDVPVIENPKGELQELLQAASPVGPSYHITSTSGPDHEPLFECTVEHEGKELARGKGKSKKAAESDAALQALTRLRAPNL